jgi:hypothetical protein
MIDLVAQTTYSSSSHLNCLVVTMRQLKSVTWHWVLHDKSQRPLWSTCMRNNFDVPNEPHSNSHAHRLEKILMTQRSTNKMPTSEPNWEKEISSDWLTPSDSKKYFMYRNKLKQFITLFRAITMLYGTDNILQNILGKLCGTDNIMQKYSSYSVWIWGIFYKILSVPQNTVMALNNYVALLQFTDFSHITW